MINYEHHVKLGISKRDFKHFKWINNFRLNYRRKHQLINYKMMPKLTLRGDGSIKMRGYLSEWKEVKHLERILVS